MSFDRFKKELSSIKLSSIVSKFLSIEKRGNYIYFAKCPFHFEKTASFAINDFKNFYYCFGCKKSGNAVTFIMNYEKIGYHAAMERLSSILSSNFDNSLLSSQNISANRLIMFSELLGEISYYYNLNLINSSDENLLSFLHDRQVDKEAISFFKLGFSVNNDAINAVLKKDFFKLKSILLELKVIRSVQGRIYDNFNNRFIFPIRDVTGKVVGFSGRSLRGDQKNKYLNSSSSDIFKKKYILYGLYEALQFNNYSAGVIVVEGYFDVISLHKSGICNVVCTMGSNCSIEQFLLLKKYYNKIVFCYDGDKAGLDASFSVAKKLLKFIGEDIYIGFVILPIGTDPDSIIRSGKKESFINIVSTPVYILDFILHYIKNYNINKNLYNLNYVRLQFKDILNEIVDLDLKKIILKYVESKFLKSQLPLYYDTFNETNFTICTKAIVYLVKFEFLIDHIDSEAINLISSSRKIDSKLLLRLILFLKNDINKKLDPFFLSYLEKHKDLVKLLDIMPKDILLREFLNIIKKIIN